MGWVNRIKKTNDFKLSRRWILPSFLDLRWVTQNLTHVHGITCFFCWCFVSTGLACHFQRPGRVLLGFTELYWVLLGFTGFYWVLLGFTGFQWVSLGFTGFFIEIEWGFVGFGSDLIGLHFLPSFFSETKSFDWIDGRVLGGQWQTPVSGCLVWRHTPGHWATRWERKSKKKPKKKINKKNKQNNQSKVTSPVPHPDILLFCFLSIIFY